MAERTGCSTVFDGFAGTTRVGQAFVKSNYTVVSNDISEWSQVFGRCYLVNKKDPKYYSELIEHLNNIRPYEGWFTQRYGGDVYDLTSSNAIQPDGSKKPWQRKNTMKLDAIRREIDLLDLDPISKSVALTSLILALDKVDSTLGHFSSYLRNWSARSFNDLKLDIPAIWSNVYENKVIKGDIFDCIGDIACDLSYFDPPYGSNNDKMPPSRVRYSAYYHIWTTIISNDNPNLFGKSLRREDTSDRVSSSVFEEYRQAKSGKFIAVEAIDRLIKLSQSDWIILSYSSGGRATAKELNEAINENGELKDVVEVDYTRNVMASMSWTGAWLRESADLNKEYLFLIKK